MNQELETRSYVAGDDIQIYFSRLQAVFEHEDFDPTIEGRGEVCGVGCSVDRRDSTSER